MFLLGAEQSTPKVIAKIENLGFKSWLSVRNADLIMVIVKSEICFNSGGFAVDAKNLQDQCVEVIYSLKTLSM